jgi:hypothetical protein
VIDSQIEQAYYQDQDRDRRPGRRRPPAPEHHDQPDAGHEQHRRAQKINDPAAIMIATARANATASTNSSFLTMGRVAEQALPLVRNVIEAIIYAVFPFVFLLFLLAQGRGLGLALKSFVLSLVWIQLWPPLYAILNYVGTLASARTSQPPPAWAPDPGPDAGHRGQHLPRRHLRPGRRRLHGGLDPHHRHRHHQGRRSRLPGSDRKSAPSSRQRRAKPPAPPRAW